jgi:hypothetical protein
MHLPTMHAEIRASRSAVVSKKGHGRRDVVWLSYGYTTAHNAAQTTAQQRNSC